MGRAHKNRPLVSFIGLFDDDLNVVVEYTYDSWGKVKTTGTLKDTLGKANPFRYRGYYYDEESGFYYLNSRYYYPEICRFINADEVAGVNNDITAYNLFAYCGNNPICRIDISGNAWETVFDVVSLGFSILEVASNPYDVSAWVGLVGDTIDLIPFVTGVGEITKGIRFVDKMGNTLEITKAMDFTDEALGTIRKLDKSSGFTKSTRKYGIDIHSGYKSGNNFPKFNKEYNRIPGIRLDYYDGTTIFELKPFNPRSAKSGVNQLRRYNNLLGGNKTMRLEFY